MNYVEESLKFQAKRANALYGDDIDLQLLVVDFGDSCAVKVEKGTRAISERDEGYKSDYMIQLDIPYGIDVGRTVILDAPFSVIRQAVNAMDEKPPVPRIERHGDDLYRVHVHEAYCKDVDKSVFKTLGILVGKQFPIYEPKKGGEWVKLLFGCEFCTSADSGHNVHCRNFGVQVPEIWRYTRKK